MIASKLEVPFEGDLKPGRVIYVDGGPQEDITRVMGAKVSTCCTEADFTRLADGRSGDLELEKAFLRMMFRGYRKFCDKQHDYGCGNISKFGELGVLVRVSDKIERLINLLKNGKVPRNEPIDDAWLDTGNYGFIALMCRTGAWPGVKPSVGQPRDNLLTNDGLGGIIESQMREG